ncbi:MAG: YbhB/YbcL family Raf kinase inhibitor-like protein [Candidatus Binataceae bacterium]
MAHRLRPARAQSSLIVESAAFAQGAAIARVHTCEGADTSPPLSWKGVPASAKTIALIVDDPDAPRGTWVHWVIFDLPANITRLDEGVAKTATPANGAHQGVNDFGRLGYNGPCPPPGSPHHYHFRLFALDSALSLPSTATAADLRTASKGHVLATGELIGTFGR